MFLEALLSTKQALLSKFWANFANFELKSQLFLAQNWLSTVLSKAVGLSNRGRISSPWTCLLVALSLFRWKPHSVKRKVAFDSAQQRQPCRKTSSGHISSWKFFPLRNYFLAQTGRRVYAQYTHSQLDTKSENFPCASCFLSETFWLSFNRRTCLQCITWLNEKKDTGDLLGSLDELRIVLIDIFLERDSSVLRQGVNFPSHFLQVIFSAVGKLTHN